MNQDKQLHVAYKSKSIHTQNTGKVKYSNGSEESLLKLIESHVQTNNLLRKYIEVLESRID